jgi:heavy metal sensor kinase
MSDERLLETFRAVFAISILLAMALAAAVGWFMARRAISGVKELTRTAGEIASGAFDKRVPQSGRGDEIDRMATTFNLMLERIQTLISKMREITDNIAHDLRSPITRIRGAAEMALTGGAPLTEYEAVTASTIEECDRLLGLINTMLEISEAEAGMVKLKLSTFDLAEMTRDACELFEPVAEDKGVIFSHDAATPTYIEGDLQKLQRALANLLDNAIKYTPPGKKVRVAMEHDERNARIIIADSGIGISQQDLPHIFERFYRGDQSRSQTGNGLGLCLSQAIARAHHGVITVDSEVGRRSTFVISLPRNMSGTSALKQD